jgi:hypothetical protein
MGADLFIEEIHNPVWQRYAPLFKAAMRRRNQSPPGSQAAETARAEAVRYSDLMFSAGYFRDSYNITSVLACLGLSWWEDVLPLCNADRVLTGAQLRRFRLMVASAQLQLPTQAELEEYGLTVADAGTYSLAGWHDYFRERHAELLAFLDQAIACQGSIRCSL